MKTQVFHMYRVQKGKKLNENTGFGEQVVQGHNENKGFWSKWLWEKYTELMTLSYFVQQTPTVIVAFISQMKAVVHVSKPHHEEKEFQMERAYLKSVKNAGVPF